MFKEFVDAKALKEQLKQAEKLSRPVELYVFWVSIIVLISDKYGKYKDMSRFMRDSMGGTWSLGR